MSLFSIETSTIEPTFLTHGFVFSCAEMGIPHTSKQLCWIYCYLSSSCFHLDYHVCHTGSLLLEEITFFYQNRISLFFHVLEFLVYEIY